MRSTWSILKRKWKTRCSRNVAARSRITRQILCYPVRVTSRGFCRSSRSPTLPSTDSFATCGRRRSTPGSLTSGIHARNQGQCFTGGCGGLRGSGRTSDGSSHGRDGIRLWRTDRRIRDPSVRVWLGCRRSDDAPGCSACNPCGVGCTPCGPWGRHWIRAEYLLWCAKGMSVPPLVTTSPGQHARPGCGRVWVCRRPTILYGSGDLLDDTQNGLRIQTGMWLDRCQWWGIEIDLAGIERSSDDFRRSSDGESGARSPVLQLADQCGGCRTGGVSRNCQWDDFGSR